MYSARLFRRLVLPIACMVSVTGCDGPAGPSDRVAPTVELRSTEVATYNTPVNLSGIATDDVDVVRVDVHVNGAQVDSYDVQSELINGRIQAYFEFALPVVRGENVVVVQAYDGAGNRGEATARVIWGQGRVVFNQDSVRLAGEGCTTEVSFRVEHLPWGNVAYSTDRPDLVRLFTAAPRTGTTSWLYSGVLGQGEGTARVIATAGTGEADTVPIHIGSAKASTELINAPSRLSAGDTASIGFDSRNACGRTVYPLSATAADAAPTRFHTLTPAVLTVVDSAYRYNPVAWMPQSVRVVGKAPGTGVLVATYRGGADTVRITIP